jgi:hypothetical protein
VASLETGLECVTQLVNLVTGTYEMTAAVA